MKDPDYVMKIMSTYGGLLENDWQPESARTYKDLAGKTQNVSFRYKIPFSNHFDYRHVVDDHNNLRHQVPSLEQTWTTHRWAIRVFSFLLAVTEVNCYLAFRYFVWDEERRMDFMAFRSKLGWALINNEFKRNEEARDTRSKKRKKLQMHHLETAPKNARKWLGTRWDKSCKQEYQQHWCKGKRGCGKKCELTVSAILDIGYAVRVTSNTSWSKVMSPQKQTEFSILKSTIFRPQ